MLATGWYDFWDEADWTPAPTPTFSGVEDFQVWKSCHTKNLGFFIWIFILLSPLR